MDEEEDDKDEEEEEEEEEEDDEEEGEDDEEEEEVDEDDEGTHLDRQIRSDRLRSDRESDGDDFYASDPPPTPSVPSAPTRRTATATVTTTDIHATPNADAVGGFQDRRGSAAPKASKKAPATADAVRRSSGRNTKGPVAASANVEPSIPSPIQSTNTADALPKPTRATRGATKGKAKARK